MNEAFNRALSVLTGVKTPITVTALIVLVFYYLIHQMMGMSVFQPLTQAESGRLLESILRKVFWLAMAGLVFGGVLFALPHFFPSRRNSSVELVDMRLNDDLSDSSGTDRSQQR